MQFNTKHRFFSENWTKNLENISLYPSFNWRYQLFRLKEIFKQNFEFWTSYEPTPQKSKKNKTKKTSFSNFFFKFQWKIYFKNCLYNQVHVLVHTEEKTKKERLSLSLACDERFVSTDTLWLHGQAFDVLYEMSEPQRICLHLTILRKKISYHLLTSSHPLSLSLTLSPLKSSVYLSLSSFTNTRASPQISTLTITEFLPPLAFS